MKKFSIKILISLAFFSVLFFIFLKIFFYTPGSLENLSSRITYPVIVTCNKISEPITKFFEKRETIKSLKEKFGDLYDRSLDRVTQIIKLNATLRQYELTKDLIEFQKRYDLKDAIIAKILAKNFSEEEHFYLINKGFQDGVEKNMVAIYKFQIIGKVTDVYKNYSKILLITDRKCKIAAYTNKTQAGGIVVGQNKINNCQMIYVNHLAKIEAEDLALSNGHGLIFPEGFCLGKIIRYEIKDFYYKIDLEPMIDFRAIKFCTLTNIEKIKQF